GVQLRAMRLVWASALVMALAFCGAARADDDSGLKPPTRGMTSDAAEREERDRVLDLAQQLRSKARGLHDKADELRQSGKDDEAAKVDDQADALEERADIMDETADELDQALSGKSSSVGKVHRPNRD